MIAPRAAASMSASAKTMNGAWPPSSSDTRLTVPAASRARYFPTSVEPVNVIFRTSGFCRSSVPTGPGSWVGTTLQTPGGSPASPMIAAILSAVSGVCSAGLRTTVHPAAIAGPIFRVTIAAGKFQGVIAPTTPTGWRSAIRRLLAADAGITRP